VDAHCSDGIGKSRGFHRQMAPFQRSEEAAGKTIAGTGAIHGIDFECRDVGAAFPGNHGTASVPEFHDDDADSTVAKLGRGFSRVLTAGEHASLFVVHEEHVDK
jgi:hypothetical protein